MLEESLVSTTKIIQPRFSIGRLNETVLGALAIANMQDFALPAVSGERILLVPSEFPLLVRGYEFDHGCLQDVSQVVIRFYKVVAGIKIPGVLQRHPQAARRPEDADSSCPVKPARQSSIEIENKSLSDISLHPLVEDLDQEAAPLGRTDRPVRDLVTFLEPAFVIPLYDGDELDVMRVEFIPEETVHL